MSIFTLLTGLLATLKAFLDLKPDDDDEGEEMVKFARELDEFEERLEEQEAELDALQDSINVR